MRPEAGYISVVSLSFNSLSISCCLSPLLAPKLTAFIGSESQGLCFKAPDPGGTRSQPPAWRGGEEEEGRGEAGRHQEEGEEGEAREGVQDCTRGRKAAARVTHLVLILYISR